MKTMKKMLSLMFCLALCFCLISAASADGEIVHSGTWGDLSWELNTEGVLTISGIGSMNDFDLWSDYAWLKYKDDINKVVIGNGITCIGSYAFEHCHNLTDITISDSVTSIRTHAFNYCYSLTSIMFPSGISSVDGATCAYCTSLKNVVIPVTVTRFLENAFIGCDALKDIYYQGTDDQWGNIFFYSGNDSLRNASIHFGSEYGIWGDLTWTLDNEGVLNISGNGKIYDFTPSYASEEAWRNRTTSIEKVIINTGVTSIGNYAFQFCDNIKSVIIPDTVTTIGVCSFRNCSSLEGLVIPEGVKQFYGETFMGCSSLSCVTLPASLTSMGGFPFANCTKLTAITVDPDNPSYCDMDGVVFSKNMAILWQYPAGREGNYRIPDSVTRILNGAFFGCSNFTAVTIPEKVKNIETSTFFGCSGLTSITIPKGVTNIGDWAFNNCDNLSDVYYAGTQTQWQTINIGNNNDYLLEATIHYNVTPDFFLPDSLTEIDEEAFAGCAFHVVQLPEETASIGKRAFADCPNLTFIYIPNETISIDEYAFDNANDLTIFGKAGSNAEEYAESHGFNFVAFY